MYDVIIPTHNGQATIGRTLDALLAARGERPDVLITVVANGCSDRTTEIAANYATCPAVHVMECVDPGKNRALNLALAATDQPIVIFLDDDVLLPSDYFDQLDQLLSQQGSIDVAGGPIVPYWPQQPSPLLLQFLDPQRLRILYAGLTIEGGEQQVAAQRLFGAMLAIRRSSLGSGKPFNESIGPNGSTSYAMGSETELLVRLDRAGVRAHYAPQLAVQHIIPAETMNWRWIFSRAERAGRGDMKRTLLRNSGRTGRPPFPRYHSLRLLRMSLMALIEALRGHRANALGRLWHAWESAGAIAEYRDSRLERQNRLGR